jgi:cyanate permease
MKINNKQKNSIYLWLILSVAAIIIWIGFGGEIFTKSQILVEKQDELMGTTIKEWKDQFVLGLDYTLGFIGIISIIAIGFIWKFKSKTG